MKEFKYNQLKQDIFRKFKQGQYEELYHKLNFDPYYFDDLTNDDFEEIFSQLYKSNEFKESFTKALKKKEFHFSIPFNTLSLIAERPIKAAIEILKEEIIKIFKTGPISIISFLSLPKYLKYVGLKEFSYSNEHIQNCVQKALKNENLLPYAAVVLKRMSMVDKDAKGVLKENYNKLFQVRDSSSFFKFQNIEVLVHGMDLMDIETLIYYTLSPEEYRHPWFSDKFKNSYLVNVIKNENLKKLFTQLILYVKGLNIKLYFSQKDLRNLSNILVDFGQVGLKGLSALYCHDSIGIKLLVLRSVTIIYKKNYNILDEKIRYKIREFLYNNLKSTCVKAGRYTKIWSEIFFILFKKPLFIFQFNTEKGECKKRYYNFKKKSKIILSIQESIREYLNERRDWEDTLVQSEYLYQKYGIEQDEKDSIEKWTYFENQVSEIRRRIELLFEDSDKETYY